MKINISSGIVSAVIAALREQIEGKGLQEFGLEDGYCVSNQDALEFFEEIREVENAVIRKLARQREI